MVGTATNANVGFGFSAAVLPTSHPTTPTALLPMPMWDPSSASAPAQAPCEPASQRDSKATQPACQLASLSGCAGSSEGCSAVYSTAAHLVWSYSPRRHLNQLSRCRLHTCSWFLSAYLAMRCWVSIYPHKHRRQLQDRIKRT